jgi:putative ABC transport system permease protein
MTPLLAEAARELRAGLVAVLASALLVAGMVTAVSLTYGRAVSAARDTLAAMDGAGARTVTVRVDPSIQLPQRHLWPLRDVSGVREVLYLGPVRDVTNASVPRVSAGLRDCYASSRSPLCRVAGVPSALADEDVVSALGFGDGVGAVTDGRTTYALRARRLGPDLPFADGVLAPAAGEARSPVAIVVVIADSSSSVAPIVALVRDLLSGLEPATYSIEDRLELIAVGDTIDDTLLASARLQATGLLVVAGAMLATAEFVSARSRRRLAGLRRAIGASRSQIVGLALLTSAAYGAAGAVLGIAITLAVSVAADLAPPPAAFLAALAIVAETIVAGAAVGPALYSSTRQPARELRVP